jgi:SAM-dependent methyltransferase
MANVMLCPACHLDQWKQQSDLYRCLSCGTEIVPRRRDFRYTESYQQDRGHYDGSTQAAKVETFIRFLKDSHVTLDKNDALLEVGFGGGAVLEYLAKTYTHVYGIEAHEAAIEKVAQRNITKQNLATNLALFKNNRKLFDVLFYLDSFEHLLNPRQHLEELENSVQKGSRAVVVLPRVDSLSRWCLGSLWPHNVPDHWVFYSHKGLLRLWESQGWRCVHTWSPRKKVSLDMILRHAGMVRVARWLQPVAQKISVWVRLGEMGVVFEKT